MASALAFTSSVRGLDEDALGGPFFDGWASPPTVKEQLALLRSSSQVERLMTIGSSGRQRPK